MIIDYYRLLDKLISNGLEKEMAHDYEIFKGVHTRFREMILSKQGKLYKSELAFDDYRHPLIYFLLNLRLVRVNSFSYLIIRKSQS